LDLFGLGSDFPFKGVIWIMKFAFMLISSPGYADKLEGEVTDQSGQALANAVVVATPTITPLPPLQKLTAEVLDQRDREFIPHVLAVRTGTEVSFPNNDRIRHHVYSFSPVKRFEIKLYKDMPPSPVIFDSPGVAVLGCNIHDWMISYVYVTDSPYFAKTNVNGHWFLELPPDSYQINLWHPDMDQTHAPSPFPLNFQNPQSSPLKLVLNSKKKLRTGKPPQSAQEQRYDADP
jgi:plastocyanin